MALIININFRFSIVIKKSIKKLTSRERLIFDRFVYYLKFSWCLRSLEIYKLPSYSIPKLRTELKGKKIPKNLLSIFNEWAYRDIEITDSTDNVFYVSLIKKVNQLFNLIQLP